MFKTKLTLSLLALTLVALAFSDFSFAQKYYKDITAPKLHDLKIPEVKQVTLDNGMQLFLLEDHELPLINVSARIRTGSIYEPAEKIGLASITGQVMRTGGTKSRTGDEIDEILESIAASVETSIGESSGSASMSVLKKDFDTGLTILADVLMNPEFRQDKIELAKVQERSSIARRNDDVGGIAFREFAKLVYGPESPYARQSEYATIDKITRDDLIAFHKKFYHPNNVMLGIWGDFNSKEIIGEIEAAFKAWPKAEIKFPPKPETNYNYAQTVNLINKDDVNQTNLVIGHIGGRRDDPDYFALILMNRILGQGFTSRLFRNVRSREGLAYSVFGAYTAEYDHPGVLYVGCQTKSETTVQAARSMLRQVKSMTEGEVTDEELAVAKDSYLNSFVFNFDTKREIVNRIMTYEYYGYPHDFLQKTKEGIEKVTKADILRVAKNNLHPDEMQILAVGKSTDFDEDLSVLGPVKEIDITIPVPAEETPEATTESLTKGKSILEKAVAACGGADAFKKVKTVQWKGDITAVTPQGEMNLQGEITMGFPDRLRIDINTPMGKISQIMNGDKVWMVTPQGARPAPSQMKTQLLESMWYNTSYLFSHADAEGLTVQYLGKADVDGQSAEIILVTAPGLKKGAKFYFSSETSLPLKKIQQSTNMMGAPVTAEEIYSDYRDVAGVKLAFKSVTNHDGKKAQESVATEIAINAKVDEAQFSVKE